MAANTASIAAAPIPTPNSLPPPTIPPRVIEAMTTTATAKTCHYTTLAMVIVVSGVE